jgi:hypothetical protein
MSYSLAFADSEVRHAAMDAGALRVAFSAAAVRRHEDDDHGWLQGLALVLDEARVAGDPAAAFGRLAEGHVRLDGRDIGRPVLPQTITGDVELALRFANGATLAARGTRLHLRLADDARFTEDLSC